MAQEWQGKRAKGQAGVPRIAKGVIAAFIVLVIIPSLFFYMFVVYVPREHIAVLIKRTGKDITNNDEVAPTSEHKGVQREFLTEGWNFLIPYFYDWKVVKHEQVPDGKVGVLISLTGDDLPYGEYLAKVLPKKDLLVDGVTTKGIVPKVLKPGRYSINPYLFELELHDPVVVPAGFKGVVTNLAGPKPEDPNQLLVQEGFRGVQEKVLDEGTEYANPFVRRINLVDCRSQKFDLSETKDMGFPSKDGFWVSLDGVIEFRVKPEMAAKVFVTYNEDNANDAQTYDQIDQEIVRKVIMPIARSFCRVEGSKSSGRDFISGETRSEFQERFEKAMRDQCEPQGIEIIQALIQEIHPPQLIADPVRKRELAKQEEKKYQQQILQQESEQKLAIEQEMRKQRPALVQADQEVVKVTTQALREQEVAVTKANEQLAVAKYRFEAAKDEAEAILARGKAEADVIGFENQAEAAGWARAVEAFGGDGHAYAKYVLNQKLAPAYRKVMANTSDSPIMNIFDSYQQTQPKPEAINAKQEAGEASDAETELTAN